jgi:hypothetical protein
MAATPSLPTPTLVARAHDDELWCFLCRDVCHLIRWTPDRDTPIRVENPLRAEHPLDEAFARRPRVTPRSRRERQFLDNVNNQEAHPEAR